MFEEYFNVIIKRIQEARKHLPSNNVSIYVLDSLNSAERLTEKAKAATRDYVESMEAMLKEKKQ